MAKALAAAVVLSSIGQVVGDGGSCPPTQSYVVPSNNPKFSGSCQVYKRGEAPCTDGQTPLSEGVGWLVVVGFGGFFTAFTALISRYEYKNLGTEQTSEQFNTAGRSIGPGLTASVIVSQWTWAATLLMSSNMGWRVGLSGPFWYASGATIQILLFAILAIQVKRRASHMHTFMEIVKARFGTVTHIIMMCFALTTNVIVTSMLLLGGASTIEDLTGMSKLTAAFLIPVLSCWLYTMYGGLRATFIASYVHTTVIFIMLIVFTFAVYAGSGEQDLWGSPAKVHQALERSTVHGFFNATLPESTVIAASAAAAAAAATANIGCSSASSATSSASTTQFFDGMGAIMQNDGTCYTAQGKNTGKSCGFSERSKDQPCCNIDFSDLNAGTYCRSDTTDCVSASADKHFESSDCNFAGGEKCVTSFLTMGSTIGLIFGITNIVGNFGTVFVDQSYWQSAVAAKPKSTVLGFLIGGMVWFAVPFCMATTTGLAGRALTMHTDINGQFGAYYITGAASSAGLTPARVLAKLMGPSGAFILLLQLFMAITSTGSAEIIAVASILTYDVYYEYINPELKGRREKLRRIFYSVVDHIVNAEPGAPVVDRVVLLDAQNEQEVRLKMSEQMITLQTVQAVINSLTSMQFFETQPTSAEIGQLSAIIGASAVDGAISIPVLYSGMNKAVASNNIEGRILLRVSKFFTGIFALLMGFLAVFLLTLGLSLGHVYMSMGCLVGSAVGPAALTILMERANGKAIGAGAVGGLILAIIGWTARAADEFGEVTYETMMQDWPWVVGNLCAIIGGTVIALVGSLIWPDNSFKWSQLNDRIALVDDVEPPKDQKEESDEKLNFQVKIAVGASLLLTFVLLFLWPIPLHLGGGVFSEGGFTVWVMLEMIWAIVGGGVIIILPAVELYQAFRGKDQVTSSAEPMVIEVMVDDSTSKSGASLDGHQAADVIKPSEVGETMNI
jgi:Na+/proline symporter